MSKSLIDKKVNRAVKNLNRSLKKDVFGTRFELRQYRKSRGNDGVEYYLYQMIDNEQPERNELVRGWETGYAIIHFSPLWIAMNDFIIKSDFWSKYKKCE